MTPLPLGWEVYLPLIVKYGIQGAFEIWKIIQSGPPTEDQWNKLEVLVLKPWDQYRAEALERNQPTLPL